MKIVLEQEEILAALASHLSDRTSYLYGTIKVKDCEIAVISEIDEPTIIEFIWCRE